MTAAYEPAAMLREPFTGTVTAAPEAGSDTDQENRLKLTAVFCRTVPLMTSALPTWTAPAETTSPVTWTRSSSVTAALLVTVPTFVSYPSCVWVAPLFAMGASVVLASCTRARSETRRVSVAATPTVSKLVPDGSATVTRWVVADSAARTVVTVSADAAPPGVPGAEQPAVVTSASPTPINALTHRRGVRPTA